MEYFIEEEGCEELGYTWNLYGVEDGKARCLAQIRDKQFSEDIFQILKWREATLFRGKVNLTPIEGPIDANTGKPWVRPVDLPSYDIKFEKPIKRPPRKRGPLQS